MFLLNIAGVTGRWMNSCKMPRRKSPLRESIWGFQPERETVLGHCVLSVHPRGRTGHCRKDYCLGAGGGMQDETPILRSTGLQRSRPVASLVKARVVGGAGGGVSSPFPPAARPCDDGPFLAAGGPRNESLNFVLSDRYGSQALVPFGVGLMPVRALGNVLPVLRARTSQKGSKS